FITNFTLVAGIMRAGYQAFPISTRNSAVGIAHLVRTTRVKYMFVGETPANQPKGRSAHTTFIRNKLLSETCLFLTTNALTMGDDTFIPCKL
ncbi:hypothetical protein MPER_05903, partial [Moniliophthora perniciosa FA553]